MPLRLDSCSSFLVRVAEAFGGAVGVEDDGVGGLGLFTKLLSRPSPILMMPFLLLSRGEDSDLSFLLVEEDLASKPPAAALAVKVAASSLSLVEASVLVLATVTNVFSPSTDPRRGMMFML